MRIDIASCSYQGGRDYNEDSVRFLENNGVCVVVVADGLGGHGGGQIASSVAVDHLTEAFFLNPVIDPEYIKHLFDEVNTKVLDKQNPSQQMKSTGVALFINDGFAIWGHAGDSRLYHFENGKLISQTLDHSISQMAVFSGEITADEIRTHEDRNKVFRAFGGTESIKAEVSPPQSITSGSHVFLLCSDGFWEYVLEAEMELDLAENETANDWLKAMIQRVSERAPDNNDNYTAAAVFITIGQETSDETI